MQTRLKEGWKANRIAREIGYAPNAVRNEIKRGTVTVALYNRIVFRYEAIAGQTAYEQNRQLCYRHYDLFETVDFINYVEQYFFEDRWFLGTVMRILGSFRSKTSIFRRSNGGHPKGNRTARTSESLPTVLSNVLLKWMTAVNSAIGRQILSSVQRVVTTTTCSQWSRARPANIGCFRPIKATSNEAPRL